MGNNNFENQEFLAEDFLETISKYLIVEVFKAKYAFSISNIKEIILLPEVVSVPESLPYERGIIKLRKNIIKVIDLRKKLKYPSIIEENNEFMKMLQQRKQDHIDWVNELVASVDEDRTFRLTNDPTQCAFGKWYHSYKAENISMAIYLAQFDHPHRTIHSIADKVKDFISRNDVKLAKKLINDTKNSELRTIIDLFDNIGSILTESNREIGVIFEKNDELFAFSADKVISIAQIEFEEIEHPKIITNKEFIKGIAKKDNEVYMILDEDKIL